MAGAVGFELCFKFPIINCLDPEDIDVTLQKTPPKGSY